MRFFAVLCFAFYAIYCLSMWFLVRNIEPYMDEPFHITQTQHYCHLRFDVWDQKITTFPGLYVICSLPSILIPGWSEWLCSVSSLRLINSIFACGTLYACRRILSGNSISASEAALKALEICTLPVFCFFIPLFYTDVGSIFFIMASFAMANERRIPLSVLVSHDEISPRLLFGR